MTRIYTAEQVADMIMNDKIGEMKYADSLDQKSTSSTFDYEPSSQSEASSSNYEPSSQSEVDSSSNSDSEFHGRQTLSKKCSVRDCTSKHAKTRGGISINGRTIRTRGGI